MTIQYTERELRQKMSFLIAVKKVLFGFNYLVWVFRTSARKFYLVDYYHEYLLFDRLLVAWLHASVFGFESSGTSPHLYNELKKLIYH
jgi:hypothetical protein